MESAIAQFGRAAADGESGPAVPGSFADCFPLLAQFFGGIRDESGKSWKLWPCTVSLWFDSGNLKFCVSPKCGPKVCFGSVKRLGEGLDGLEAALANGDCEWKTRKASR